MPFHSPAFLIFFPVVVIVYFMLPGRLKRIWLLAASYYFYMYWNVRHALLLAFSTTATWLSGLLLGICGACENRKKYKKMIVFICFLLNLGILLFFKYTDFILNSLNFVLKKTGAPLIQKPFDIILPAGISFYTFQALGYTIDVYRGDIAPEKNFINYALFVSFFPQMTAGPIERSKNLLKQIHGIKNAGCRQLFQDERIYSGLVMMLWGYFQKLVLADRLSILTDTVYDSWQLYGTTELLAATAAFSIQIYCDFASYSTIAAGAAKVMGFSLMENFRSPYFSRSIQEFWRRWHISLSTWFKDYLYIPLGGNRCGILRRNLNIMITFLVSGLWHGAAWHYVIWGAVHGIYQITGSLTNPLRKKLRQKTGVDTGCFSFRFGQTAVTYALVLFALIFFRSESLTAALGCIKRIFTNLDPWAFTDGTLFQLGLDHTQMGILAAALAVLLMVSLIRELKNETLDVFLSRQCMWFQCLVIIVLFSFLFLFGIYGPDYDESQFIYFQF